MANLEYHLTYENEENTSIEANFIFPLDEQSAIYKFEAEIGDRLIVGECQAKEQVSCDVRKYDLVGLYTCILIIDC